jgi:ABC-type Fe3+-hydroxamate transport system substrate-binding protein
MLIFFHWLILAMILQQPSNLPCLPQRIISLVPSQTELLFDLGLHNETVGITKFCVHPQAWFTTKDKIGGTKTIDIEKIKGLQPDLLIANKEENVKDQIEELAKDYPVWLTDVNNLADALQMITDIGILTGKADAATVLANGIRQAFIGLPVSDKPVKAVYLIWRKPYMTVGGDTFIHDMLQRCGFQNIFAENTRYPQISIPQLQTANCQLLLLSSEPYPFKQKHAEELGKLLPQTTVVLVDGEMFSWYGSRLLQSASYFNQLIARLKTR